MLSYLPSQWAQGRWVGEEVFKPKNIERVETYKYKAVLILVSDIEGYKTTSKGNQKYKIMRNSAIFFGIQPFYGDECTIHKLVQDQKYNF